MQLETLTGERTPRWLSQPRRSRGFDLKALADELEPVLAAVQDKIPHAQQQTLLSVMRRLRLHAIKGPRQMQMGESEL